ncbi:MAG: hypothetical protein MZW92_60515 [Comamonadaceae bacterium]|nr:hypothetical protein [Comamonadaceae bacterium]
MGRSSRPTSTATVYHLAWSPDGDEDPLRQQGLRRSSCVDVATKKLDEDRRVEPAEERRVHLGDRRLRPGRPTAAWIAYTLRRAQPQQPGLPLQPRDREEASPVTDDFYDNLNPSLRRRTATTSTSSPAATSTARMDFYEDNHVIASPGPGDGRPAAGRRRRRRSPSETGQPKEPARRPARRRRFRHRPRTAWSQRDLPAARRRRATTSSSRPARARCSWALDRRPSARTSTRTIFTPLGRGQVDAAHLRHGRAEGRRRSTARSRDCAALAERRADRSSQKGRTSSRRRRRQGCAVEDARRRSSTSTRHGLPGRARGRVARRSSTTPGAGTATSSTTPTCTAATGRRSATSYRAMIPAAHPRGPSSTGSCRRWSASCASSHTYVGGGDMGPARRRRSPVFTGLPRRRPRRRRRGGPLPLRADLRPDATYNRDLDGAARRAPTSP